MLLKVRTNGQKAPTVAVEDALKALADELQSIREQYQENAERMMTQK